MTAMSWDGISSYLIPRGLCLDPGDDDSISTAKYDPVSPHDHGLRGVLEDEGVMGGILASLNCALDLPVGGDPSDTLRGRTTFPSNLAREFEHFEQEHSKHMLARHESDVVAVGGTVLKMAEYCASAIAEAHGTQISMLRDCPTGQLFSRPSDLVVKINKKACFTVEYNSFHAGEAHLAQLAPSFHRIDTDEGNEGVDAIVAKAAVSMIAEEVEFSWFYCGGLFMFYQLGSPGDDGDRVILRGPPFRIAESPQLRADATIANTYEAGLMIPTLVSLMLSSVPKFGSIKPIFAVPAVDTAGPEIEGAAPQEATEEISARCKRKRGEEEEGLVKRTRQEELSTRQQSSMELIFQSANTRVKPYHFTLVETRLRTSPPELGDIQPLKYIVLDAFLAHGGVAEAWRGVLDNTKRIVVKIYFNTEGAKAAAAREGALFQGALASLPCGDVPLFYGSYIRSSGLVRYHLIVLEDVGACIQDPLVVTPAQRDQIYQKLLRIHARGVIHGDLEWRNITIHPEGEPVLIDFSHSSLHTCRGEDQCAELQAARTKLGLGKDSRASSITG